MADARPGKNTRRGRSAVGGATGQDGAASLRTGPRRADRENTPAASYEPRGEDRSGRSAATGPRTGRRSTADNAGGNRSPGGERELHRDGRRKEQAGPVTTISGRRGIQAGSRAAEVGRGMGQRVHTASRRDAPGGLTTPASPSQGDRSEDEELEEGEVEAHQQDTAVETRPAAVGRSPGQPAVLWNTSYSLLWSLKSHLAMGGTSLSFGFKNESLTWKSTQQMPVRTPYWCASSRSPIIIKASRSA